MKAPSALSRKSFLRPPGTVFRDSPNNLKITANPLRAMMECCHSLPPMESTPAFISYRHEEIQRVGKLHIGSMWSAKGVGETMWLGNSGRSLDDRAPRCICLE